MGMPVPPRPKAPYPPRPTPYARAGRTISPSSPAVDLLRVIEQAFSDVRSMPGTSDSEEQIEYVRMLAGFVKAKYPSEVWPYWVVAVKDPIKKESNEMEEALSTMRNEIGIEKTKEVVEPKPYSTMSEIERADRLRLAKSRASLARYKAMAGTSGVEPAFTETYTRRMPAMPGPADDLILPTLETWNAMMNEQEKKKVAEAELSLFQRFKKWCREK